MDRNGLPPSPAHVSWESPDWMFVGMGILADWSKEITGERLASNWTVFGYGTGSRSTAFIRVR